MHVVLVGGLWLDSSVWSEVVSPLVAGYELPVSPVDLPVHSPGEGPANLEDQLNAVLAAIDSRPEQALVVGHSAAATLAWLAADRRPGHVGVAMLVGGFPATGGEQYAPLFPIVDGAMPFPGWDAFAGPDSQDLTEEQKQDLAATAIAVPEGVARATVTYGTEARFETPTVLVCPEYSPQDAQRWIMERQIPELEHAGHIDYANIDSGHWPMLTQPRELAEIIAKYAW